MTILTEKSGGSAGATEACGKVLGDLPADYKRLPGYGAFEELIGPLLYRKLGAGRFLYGFQSDNRHANANNTIHGGMLYSFADQFMGLSMAMAAKGYAATITLNVEYLSPGRVGDWIEGEMEVTGLTGDLGYGHARVFAKGRDLMTASGVFKLFQGRKAQTQPQERSDSIA